MSESCSECMGRGYVVTCIDDMCNGQDECVHGDGEQDCPSCGGEGRFDDDGFEDDGEPGHMVSCAFIGGRWDCNPTCKHFHIPAQPSASRDAPKEKT